MSEINNDLKDEAVVTEKVAEVSPEVVEAPAPEVEKAPVVEEAPKVEEAPAKEEKPKAKKEAKADVKSEETVAIFAKGNFSWSEVGKVSAGYNIVSKEDADKWLTINGIRLATPEEIAAKVAK